jgi:hypothetical protein
LPWDDDIDVGVQWQHLFALQWISKVYRNPNYELVVNPHSIFGEIASRNAWFAQDDPFSYSLRAQPTPIPVHSSAPTAPQSDFQVS